MRAREAVAAVKQGVIWLAESVHASWVAERRAAGLPMLSDCELYQAFDLTYDHDIWPLWQTAVAGKVSVARYLEMLRFQDCIYPAHYVKMRCVENHDQPRIMTLAPTRAQALAWTAFQAFNKGAFLIYAGQESGATNTPSRFDVDAVEWGEYALAPFITRLAQLKKERAQREGAFVLLDAEPAIQAAWTCDGEELYGVFNVEGSPGQVTVRLPDGVYVDLLSDRPVQVRAGQMPIPEGAMILRWTGAAHGTKYERKPVYSLLLDHR